MSFASTPLGQGRRLDRDTFLQKNLHKQNSLHSHGGSSTLSAKPNSQLSTTHSEPSIPSQSARPAYIHSRTIGPPSKPHSTTLPTQAKPDSWSVRDTSVNVANALAQAASDPQSSMVPNNYTRATSVEFEASLNQLSQSRRPPVSNRAPPPRRPIEKTRSAQHVSDSEGEIQPGQNGKGRENTPMGFISNVVKGVSYYVREGMKNPNLAESDSYDYQEEEEQVRDAEDASQAGMDSNPEGSSSSIKTRQTKVGPRRSKMRIDNKAYKPSLSEEESDDFELDSEKRTRKKKKKQDGQGGPLNTLPMITPQKKRRRKTRRGENGVEEEVEDDEGSSSEDEATAEQAPTRIREPSLQPRSRQGSVAPSRPPHHEDLSHEQTLQSIPEDTEAEVSAAQETSVEQPSPFKRSSGSASFGAVLGTAVNFVGRMFLFLVMFLGRICGLIYDLLLNRPSRLTRRHSSSLLTFATWAAVLGLGYVAFNFIYRPFFIPSGSGPVYVAPDVPAASIEELSTRLRQIESVVSSLSKDLDSSRAQRDAESRNQAAMGGRISALESYRSSADQGIHALRHQIDLFHTQLDSVAKIAQERPPATDSDPSEIVVSDEEARALLRRLEERVAGMEDSVQEALELGKNTAKADPSSTNEKGSTWWNKVASGVKSGATIRTSDGQDITGLIKHLVDDAVSMYGKDNLGRQDFALASGGAHVIPSLTSPTYTLQPPTIRRKIMGWISSTGFLHGRPPVTALHHDNHEGHCWPFAGSRGHLGVALKAPAYITDVTIEHAPQEVAYDLSGAPRDMELWAMVEGKDNQEKVLRWREEQASQKAARKAEAEARGEEWVEELEVYPNIFTTNPPYIRIANFTYDIHGPNHIQTFPILPEIQDLRIDFGIVTLLIKSNWGRPEFTCLYRFRVHGERFEQDTTQETVDT